MTATIRLSRRAGPQCHASAPAHWNPRPLALALALLGTAAGAQVPTGFNPVRGTVDSPVMNGNTMSITQRSDRAIIEWGGFSIGKDHAVRFLQPGASSIALNRVVGGELSEIAGALSANGKIFLINPAGVLFGAGSRVDTGGLIASTLNIANDDFMAGRFNFERDPANTAGITNLGTLSAPGATIALMAATVANQGTVQADGGTVGLVSARKVTLDFQGDGLTTFRFDPAARAATASVANGVDAVLQANGGRVAVLADSAQVAQMVVNQQGTLRARSVAARNGEIILGASGDGDVRLGGTLDASGMDAGTSGGRIAVHAGGIRTAGGTLDARGRTGGGQVELDGSRAITLDGATRLQADALERGSGGRINVDAGAGGLHLAGTLTAGAAGRGEGGRIATSGAVVEVGVAHVAAAGAGGGANGKWTITSAGDVTIGAAPGPRGEGEVSAARDDSRVAGAALGEALGRSTDVTVAATGFDLDGGRGQSGNVVFESNAEVLKQAGEASTLRIDAMRDITMDYGSRIKSQAGPLHVEFNADSSGTAKMRRPQGDSVFVEERGGNIGIYEATIVTRGGDVRLFGQSDAVNGHASGGTSFSGNEPSTDNRGIDIWDSRIDLCADAACTGGGSFSAAGRGLTSVDEGEVYGVDGGIGVLLSRVQVRAGRDIEIKGHGGVGAAGILIDGSNEGPAEGELAAAGNITLTGTAEDATLDDKLLGSSVEAGVGLYVTRVRAGGDVLIDGKGSNLAVLTGSEEARKLLDGGRIDAVDGVRVFDTAIEAGAGRTLRIAGTAGSDGIDGASDGTYAPIAARGVRVEQRFGGSGIPPSTIETSGGTIELVGRGSDVWLASEAGEGGSLPTRVDAGSAAGRGGEVRIEGRNIALQGRTELAADGAAGGGRVTVRASGMAAMDAQARAGASATGASGAGGDILLYGAQGLRAHGAVTARGTGSGAGGHVETSGGAFDLQGIRVDAGSAGGAAGTWLIDPYDVDIVHGAAAGSLPSNPFEPLADSTVQDADINSALDAGTSVTIGTGTGGSDTDGNIAIRGGVEIRRTLGSGALDLTFNAHQAIGGEDFVIESTAGALNLAFNSNASGTRAGAASIAFDNADLRTNGGSVRLYGQSDPAGGSASSDRMPAISLNDTNIDTRVGQSDAGPGGDVLMRGMANGPESVRIAGGSIQASTGDVTVRGVSSGFGPGVTVQAGDIADARIATTTGNISIIGIGGGDASFGADGVTLAGAHVQTRDGTIDVRGLAQGPGTTGAGVVLEDASLVVQGTGRAWVTGQSEGGGEGIDLQGGTSGSSAYAIDGGAQAVVLRADNDGSGDAIDINAAIRSGSAINLRPGGVDAAGNAVDHVGTAISTGGPDRGGFSLSTPELAYLQAPDLIIGSDLHVGNISVDGAVATANNLSLQTEGGGAIAVNGAVSAATLALLAGGDVTQSAAGSIAAGSLLARSGGGSVLLTNPANAVATLAGGAGADFRYVDADGVSIGATTARGMGAATNAAQSLAVDGIVADRAVVQAGTGDIAVDAPVAAPTAVTLQADAGAIRLNRTLQSGVVALLSQGAISQQAGARIAADTLVARSTAGAVTLTDAGNQAAVLAGSAATDFRYMNAEGLMLGSATAAYHDAAGNLQAASVEGLAAGTAQIAAAKGDLVVGADATAAGLLSLQADTGAIAVHAGTQADTVVLLAGGNISQTAAGGVTAESLLVRAAGGSASLVAGDNDIRTLAGHAAGNLHYRGAGDIAIGTVAASALGAGGAPQPASAAGVAAGDAIVQATSGNLSVQAVSAAAGGLTLQADTGNLAIGQAVQGATVALLAGGDVGQTAAGAITATDLLARSTGGNVRLEGGANRVGTVAGGAAGTFAYTDADALRIGAVTAARLDAEAAVSPVTAGGIGADATVVRTLADDLTLAADVTGGVADLVAAERFQNPGGASIATAGRWRVWANTWEGETRGGLAGSGPLPNLYNRAYGAAVGDSDNHFIYRQQPTVTITLDSGSRPAGQANPPLGYAVSGLILGDTGAGISGAAGTSANASSPAGVYAVTATTPFVSAEGYAINVVPGQLRVNSLALPSVDIQRDIPTTYLYDRNLAPVAMCFATGPLTGDKAEQVGDVLAREWSRVRSRPNLSNCVSTDRTNACADF